MRKLKLGECAFAVSALLLFAACSEHGASEFEPRTRSAGKATPLVCVVNYPLKYFAERIAGDNARVEFPAPRDEDPAHWIPDADIVAAYQKADIILLNGAGYARWIQKMSLPRSKLVNTSGSFQDRYIRIDGAVTHKHGPKGEHEHTETVFTTWLNPRHAIRQAQAIEEALIALIPDKQETFKANYEALEKNLMELDESIAKVVGENRERPLFFSHPVYDYLVRRYELNARSVHWEPGETPDAKMWQELEILLAEHPAEWMVWEGEPLEATEDKLETLGVGSIVFDPCGNAPEEGDYLSVMRRNAENLKSVFQ